jgi:actin-related protein
MKRFFKAIGLLILMIATAQCFAGSKDQKALAKEQRQLEKELKKQECVRKKEMRKLEKQQAKARRAEERMEKKEARKAKKYDKTRKAEEREMKKLEKENKKLAKKEQKKMAKMQKAEDKRLACILDEKEEMARAQKREALKSQKWELENNWKSIRKSEVEKEYKDGKYAGICMLPAWPFASWFFKEKAILNVAATYWYATDAYDSDGASKDITSLDFGYQTIHLKDILLASKLLGDQKVEPRGDYTDYEIDSFIYYFGNQAINFNGKSEKYGLEFDFARHVLRDDISIGIQIPFLYAKNHLDANMEFCGSTSGYGAVADASTLDYQEILTRILKAKGIKELGGSAAGFGDISLFGNFEISTKYIKKVVAGLKAVLPTGKGESMCKLWSPALWTNGNCAEFAAYVSMLVNYNRYVNPHLFLQASFFSTGNVDKRIPHNITSPVDAVEGEPVGNDLMAMGDRIFYNDESFQGVDAAIPGFADRPISVKYQKGPEFHMRLGNVFDKFFCRHGFLDIYYDLRFKMKDEYRAGADSCCVNKCEYNIECLERNTKAVEHRLGMEFSHQFDPRTRLKASMTYSVAGMNAPKAFDIGVLLGHSF